MDRPAVARRNVAIVVTGSLLLALLWVFTNPMSVDAQATEPAVVSVGNYEIGEPGEELVVMVAFDPGSTPAAAVSGMVSYDETELGFVSCEAAGLGTCNKVDGGVRFAAISMAGWPSTPNLLSITFDSSNLTHGSELVLTVDEMYDTAVVAIEEFTVLDGAVALTTNVGVLTGDVVDGASNVGVHNLEVCASAGDVGETRCTTTNVWGSYRIDGLASSSYSLTIVDSTGYYAPATITDVLVSSPTATTGVDAALSVAFDEPVDMPADDPVDTPADPIDELAPPAAADGGAITGTVFNAAGVPVFGVQVCTSHPFVPGQNCALTRTDGSYKLGNLTTGNYSVTATDPGRRYGDAATEYFGVVSPRTRSDIDLSLPAR